MSALKIVAGLSLVTLFTACSDGVGPGAAAGKQTVNLNISAVRSGPAAAAPESVTVNGHTLVFGKVELVIAKFKLKRISNSVDCTEDGPSDSVGSGGAEASHGDDDCNEVDAGPFLVDLPLGGGIKRIVSVEVDTGTYRRVEYKIHKAEDHNVDGAFLSQHPDLEGVSVRVTGVYDGAPFVYVADLKAKQKNDLVPPLVVGAAGATDFTLAVDISRWFVTSGGALVDPVTALKGGPNDNLVRDNIRRSFRCFKDHDRDGHDD